MRLEILKDCTLDEDGIMAKKGDVIFVNTESSSVLISAGVAINLDKDMNVPVEKSHKSSKKSVE